MAHVYADLTTFKKYLTDLSDSFGSDSDADLLNALESASRTVDGHCNRTGPDHPMSGFGPRLGTNRYDGRWGSELALEDDLLSVTTVVGGSGTLVDETDFFKGPYDRAPYRYLTSPLPFNLTPWWTYTRRAVTVLGKWGYQDVTVLATAVNDVAGIANVTTTTTITTDAALIPGQTILIDAEQLYVRSVNLFTSSMDRAVNGTAAAAHLDNAPVSYFQYPSNVTRATLAIAQRRRKSRDAGLSGDFGGAAGMPTSIMPDRTERWILDDFLNDFKFALVA